MITEVNLALSPADAFDHEIITATTRRILSIKSSNTLFVVVRKRSVDARSKNPLFILKVDAYVNEQEPKKKEYIFEKKNVGDQEPVFIIGSGLQDYLQRFN